MNRILAFSVLVLIVLFSGCISSSTGDRYSTASDTLGVGALRSEEVLGIDSSEEAKSPMKMMCSICPIEKSLHWVCWFYDLLYWFVVELPEIITNAAKSIGFLGGFLGAILTGIRLLLVGGLIVAGILIVGQLGAIFQLVSVVHEQPFIRAAVYVLLGFLMLMNQWGTLSWMVVGSIIGIVAFIDGIGITKYTIAGLNFWVGIGWAIILVLVGTTPIGMLVMFFLAAMALGPAFGLPWGWFEDSLDMLLTFGLAIFVILCFYPSVVPGFESILRIFDFLLRTLHIYEMPCSI